ncbi:ribonuclease T2 family protein [Agrobacterium vaccinii]|uniref:ribonuclease T2 family protein n=1 Tax=Agrobacterium vaccinii TaxID=2735528 RepID=UPI001E3B4AF8|nr:ribonuclease [Agrobacterium vaccinii]UHS56190.1 ribonuclease [Agrobacterium vaccinii]
MKQYAGFIALGVLSLAAAGWMMMGGHAWEPSQSNISVSSRLPSPTRTAQPVQGSGFDFYVLSLSWSPAFCASDAGKNSRQQCGTNRRYGFIVHGLWPQNEQGYPEFCGKDREERVPEALGRYLFDIMPSMGLIGHQWRKHGTCSGLSQKDYLTTIRAAYERVTLPGNIASGTSSQTLSADAIETAFVSSNPGLSKRGVAISCQGPKLEEVRICMNKDLSFRDCSEADRRGCRASSTEILPISKP